MKVLLFSALIFSLGATAQVAQVNSQGQAKSYSPNSGNTPPGTFESKSTRPSSEQKTGTNIKRTKTTVMDVQEQQAPTSSETGIQNSSGITTDQMNTSPNNPPSSEQEMMRDTTLSKDPTNPAEVQAQDEENALDYSTTPQKDKKK